VGRGADCGDIPSQLVVFTISLANPEFLAIDSIETCSQTFRPTLEHSKSRNGELVKCSISYPTLVYCVLCGVGCRAS